MRRSGKNKLSREIHTGGSPLAVWISLRVGSRLSEVKQMVLDNALLVARLLLAAVFMIAALGKVMDLKATQQAFASFGFPKVTHRPLTFLLPTTEAAVAVALVPESTSRWAAAAALGMLLLFTAAIVLNLRRGRRPACRCFGQPTARPISAATVIRNLLLILVGSLVVWKGPGATGLAVAGGLTNIRPIEGVGLLLGVVSLSLIIGEAWLLVQLLSQNGRLLLRLDGLETRFEGTVAKELIPTLHPAPSQPGLPVGSVAPPFRLEGLYGETLTLDALRAIGKPVLLTFMDPGCGPCDSLLPDLARWQRDYVATLLLVVVSTGNVEANRFKSRDHGLSNVLLQEEREVAVAYEANGTPSAVLVLTDGVVGSPIAAGTEAIRRLVQATAGDPTKLAGMPSRNGWDKQVEEGSNLHNLGEGNGRQETEAQPPVGSLGRQAPDLRLPDLSGKMVDLATFRGTRTLVLFWNPSCGFCQKMLGDIKAWETNRPKGSPKLLVVSTDSVEANRALSLRSTVVLDSGFRVSSSFGANGTPSAVLVDAAGRIASDLAVGASAVFALASPDRGTIAGPA
jgi:thiol-disulfide isomerase/thioredoxin/uncharacterized membrane protein YphA (DoxX/SURF4 family)